MHAMGRYVRVCGMVLAFASLAQAQTSQSSYRPATTQTASEPLVGGAIRFVPPAGWTLLEGKTDRLVRYELGERKGFLEVAVDVLPVAVGPAQAQQMSMQVGKAIREQAKAEGRELLYGPRAEKDDRFWLTMRDRAKLKSGEVADRVQVFRVIGVYIVRVAATGITESEDEAKKVHNVGQDLLDKIRVSRGVKPSFYPKTQIKITPPVDWKELKTDQPNGLVSTLTDAKKPNSKIIVRARILPKDARTDETKRKMLLEKMIDDERQTAPYSKTAKSVNETEESDPKLLKHLVGKTTDGATPLIVHTRYQVVGDVIISVRSVCEEADAAGVDEAVGSMIIAPIRE